MKQETKFVHRISKGSRFNQIYIPKEMNEQFGIGDIVEIRLVSKKSSLYYSENLKKLNNYKEKLINEIFSFLSKNEYIDQIFVFGSFLLNKIDYNDLDILIISDKNIENKIYAQLVDIFNIKFHIIVMPKNRLNYLSKICPLTRSMLYYFVSNKKFELPKEIQIDINHINFLLMMPEDLLNLNLESRIYYDSLRRLITIHKFIENKNLDPNEINKELREEIGDTIYFTIKNNEIIEKKKTLKLKFIIKNKLKDIKNKKGIRWVKKEI